MTPVTNDKTEDRIRRIGWQCVCHPGIMSLESLVFQLILAQMQ